MAHKTLWDLALSYLQPHLLSPTQGQSPLDIQAVMVVHIFGKQAPNSGPLLLLFPLMSVDLNFLSLPRFLHRGFGVHSAIPCLER